MSYSGIKELRGIKTSLDDAAQKLGALNVAALSGAPAPAQSVLAGIAAMNLCTACWRAKEASAFIEAAILAFDGHPVPVSADPKGG